ncbi:MAG: inositol monophosphatase family protein [Acidobacteriota bacterium]
MLNFAVSLAYEAGKILRDNFGREITINAKGEGYINLVTEIDLLSENFIKEQIASHFPKHQILAEEGGMTATASDYCWIVDPLDGTTNYAHGYPVFAVSIALARAGEPILGVVYDPMRDEIYVAESGAGATLNNRRIRVSETTQLAESLLVTGFPYDIKTSPENNLNHFARFSLAARAIRRDGSAALDLCYTAAGRFDGFWEMKLGPWDAAAGALIVTEAGGYVTKFDGSPFDLYKGELLATNGLIHEEMLQVLRS